MKDPLIIFAVLVAGFLIGFFTLAGRATHFCNEQGFEEWSSKGCYNEDQIYQNDLIDEKE